MSEGRVNIYKKNGVMLGYFRQPKISQFGNDEYEIQGVFYDAEGALAEKIEFNPQSLPYWAEIKDTAEVKHSQLTNVYIQRGRQPVTITGLGS
jgi:hypothetical protein